MNTLGSNNTGQTQQEPPMRIANEEDWWRMLYPDLDLTCPAYHEPRQTYGPPIVHTETASSRASVRGLIPNS